MGLSTFLGANLTPYTNTELWVTRSCLLISAAIIGPTVILIILDLCLWIVRAGHGPSTELLRRSKSGIDNLHQRARRRSRSNSVASSAGSTTMEMTTTNSNTTTNTATAGTGSDVPSREMDENLKAMKETTAVLKREETDPVGGVSDSTASRSKDFAEKGNRDGAGATKTGSPLTELKLGKVIS